MTKAEPAKRVHSGQLRIAKAEMDVSSVSIELLIWAMLAAGATAGDIGEVIAEAGTDRTLVFRGYDHV